MPIRFIQTNNLGGHKSKNGDKAINNLRKLNIFVGKNNSGKSRFLRHLVHNRHSLIDKNIQTLHEQISKLYDSLAAAYPNVVGRSEFFLNDLQEIIKDESQELPKKISILQQKLERVVNQNGDTSSGGASQQAIAKMILSLFTSNEFMVAQKKEKEILYAYIPILRGLRPLVQSGVSAEGVMFKNEDCYEIRTRADYFKGNMGEDVVLFSGLNLYQEIKDLILSSDRKERDFPRSFEKFLSKNFFNNKEVILTPAKDKDVISISIDGEERAIYDLGDGIQSIICNTFLAYKHQDKNLILFIEEPEILLHPGMQRVLIEVLLKELTNVQIFLTTHSNHFLDLVYDYKDDVSVYSFEKINQDFLIENITSNKTVIDILGIRNSSVYLANCVVWMEGVSDRIYLKKFLELYSREKIQEYKEDYHYAVSEYGGSNIENFDFLELGETSERVRVNSISNRNLIVADNDGNKGKSGKKGDRLKKLEEVLGNGFYDDYIEIENLIPYKVYKPVILNLLSDERKQIKLKEEITDSETKFDEKLQSSKIGSLLKKYFIEEKGDNSPEYFSNENVECLGVNKKYLADLVVEEIENQKITFTQLPKHTQDFVEKVVSFIKLNNPQAFE